MSWLLELLIWLKSLFSSKPSLAPVVPIPTEEDPPWLKIARAELGQKEFMPGDNPRIVEYHSVTALKASDDETPWCSSFVSWCLEKSGILSTRNAWARSYLSWGDKLDKPRLGCIVVFSRGTTSGHVGFFLGETVDSIKLLGGNQSNAVTISFYSKVNLLGYRWPKNI